MHGGQTHSSHSALGRLHHEVRADVGADRSDQTDHPPDGAHVDQSPAASSSSDLTCLQSRGDHSEEK